MNFYMTKNIWQYEEKTFVSLSNFLKKKNLTAGIANASLNLSLALRNKLKKVRNIEKTDPAQFTMEAPSSPLLLHTQTIALIAELSIPPCTNYRVEHKIKLLEEIGFTVFVTSWTEFQESFNNLQLSEAVIFYRTPYTKEVEALYKEARRLSIPIIYDIDDLIFDIKAYSAYLEKTKLSKETKNDLLKGAELYALALKNSDIFITTTKELQIRARALFPALKIFILPNAITKYLTDTSKQKSYPLGDTSNIKIFYGSGTSTHNEDFELISRPMAKILQKYPNVELWIAGLLKLPDYMNEFDKQIKRIPLLPTGDYLELIQKFNIAVVPLVDSVFNRSKSNIKYIESSYFSIPSVCSSLPEFSNIIDDGLTGFLAKNEDEWYSSLCSLIDSATKRKEVGKAANAVVVSLYSHEVQKRTLSAIFQEILPIIPPDNREKVLFTNIYYGLSSFGGATKVVENICNVLEKESSVYRPVVFTTHRDSCIGSLRRYNFQGVTVFSLSHLTNPLEIKNSIVQTRFKQVLSIIRPNIVHHHAVQGLALSLSIEETVPIVPRPKQLATIHDSWFCCPSLFKAQEGCEFTEFSPCKCETLCGFEKEFIYRRMARLSSFFSSCDILLAPSSFFAEHIKYFFPETPIKINENGIHCYPQTDSMNSGPLRIGFFGGPEKVKGHEVLEKALAELTDFEWHLIVTAKNKQYSTNLEKGRVTILDYLNPESLWAQFKNIDVLVFPSTIFESFGLLPREALAAGVYLISSQTGGARGLIPNNMYGIEIPRKDSKALAEALRYAINNLESIRNGRRKRQIKFKTYAEQVSELELIYSNMTHS